MFVNYRGVKMKIKLIFHLLAVVLLVSENSVYGWRNFGVLRGERQKFGGEIVSEVPLFEWTFAFFRLCDY